jgi:hypothetical protein
MLGWSIIHSQLDDLQRHAPADGRLLLGDIDDAEASLADLLQQAEAADDGLCAF